MTRNELIREAKQDIIDKLADGYNGYLCDLHGEVFNTDYYVDDNAQAEEWIYNYEESVFTLIGEIYTYEKDNFGEVYTDLSSPMRVVNMFYYIIGEIALGEFMDDIDAEDRESIDELWNCELDDNECKFVLAKFKEVMD